ncbi:MAG TPA: FAD-dependent oxidoreductase, partial [Anaerolineae bacterium]|nr:FAD-dependent oxidoreductase [Anaerolineae bacterium]
AKDVVGGMMRLVPKFRLPDAIIRQDVERITRLGVEIKLSHPITKPPEALLEEGFDAVYIACGFQKSSRLDIEGMQGQGVFAAFDVLERARRGQVMDLGGKALVIGGGDTAMDAARVAQRFTSNPATVVYRRSRQEMPAHAEELQGAFEEGNLLIELATPTRVLREQGRVVALECVRNRLGEPGKDGRRRPIPVDGSEFQIEADAIIVAIGQRSDVTFLDGSIVTVRRDGSINVDPTCGLAGADCVYAGGDIVDGPESIIAACADGRRAAEAICAQLDIEFAQPQSRPALLSEEEILQVKRARARKEPQQRPGMIPSEERGGFGLIEATLTEEAARAEALRCLQCSSFCDKCVEVCPNRSNFTCRVSPVNLTLPVLACQDAEWVVEGQETFRVEQSRQIIHIADFCNECGNCATFCVHQGKPYLDKPRLFLDRTDYEREEDNGWHIEGNTIWRREAGRESKLSSTEGTMVFENAQIRAVLAADFALEELETKAGCEESQSLRGAAEMALVLEGVTGSLQFLLG